MKTMQYWTVGSAVALHLVAGAAWADPQDAYRVTAPPAFPIYNTSAPSDWAATNAKSVIWSAGGSGKTTNGYPNSADTSPSTRDFRLVESVLGSSVEHIKPKYYLGDQLVAPTNVNWDATFALLTNSPAYANNAVFFDASTPGIFFSEGGLINVVWVLADGSSETNSYQVGGSSRAKPYRIYWTDEPYNAPPVDLTGKFVQFFGNSEILTTVYGAVTNTAGGMDSVSTNVVKGLFLDSATHWLKAIGGIKGQVVMAYYSTGNFDQLLGTIVIEVCAPDLKTVSADIGSVLKPTGDGYDVIGLNASVTAGLNSGDDVGPYLYQHKGQHSYSPKNGNLYAIRKTVGEPWKIEVYWRQKDLMGTSWPFEVLNYECDWPVNAEPYVRGSETNTDGTVNFGLTIPIPEAYTPTLMGFQEPEGHARLDAQNIFSTKTNGFCLLQLKGTDANGDDNVWFLPVQSIQRDEPQFDLTPGDWPVGVEVTPLPTAVSLAFDGLSSYLDTGITNELDGSFTIEGYFQFARPAQSGQSQTLFFKQAVSTNASHRTDFRVELSTNGALRAIFEAPTGAEAAVITAGPVGLRSFAWRHVALIYDGALSNAMLCVDGVATSVGSFERTTNRVGLLQFGRSAAHTGGVSNNFFTGKMDDLRVWNRALGTNEIQQGLGGFLHNASSAAQLVAYYPINNDLGRVVTDASTNGYAAMMVNCIRSASGAVGLSDLDGFSAYHAYVYEPVSGDNYHPQLYVRPDQLTSTNDPSTGSNTNETYLFAVNQTPTNGKPLEVWWSHAVLQEAMPDPLWFPAWVQRYRFHWPREEYAVPQIALASQLGSANLSLSKRGAALDFSQSLASRMRVPAGDWFAGANYTVACWIKPHSLNPAFGRVFDFNDGNAGNRVSLSIHDGGSIHYRISAADGVNDLTISPAWATNHVVSQAQWNHLALVVSNRVPTVYLNGAAIHQDAGTLVPTWTGATTNNYLAHGVADGIASSFDGQIDDFLIWGVACSSNEVRQAMFNSASGSEPDLRLGYTFDHDVGVTTAARYVYDRVRGLSAFVTFSSFALPGAPQLDPGVLISAETPLVYVQNDQNQPGYNPNEEHAFIRAGSGGYVTYALRCDLNQGINSSEPYVLVQYNDPARNGRPNLQLFEVVTTNSVYPAFAATMTAGTLVAGPHPLDLLPDPWNTRTYWLYAGVANNTSGPGYRDRKCQIWAKRAGMDGGSDELVMHNFYPVQDGFFFPSLPLTDQPAVQTPVPWLCRLTNPAAELINGDPIAWTWTVQWPTNAPVLDIGQTLTTATRGLPEVWNAKSMMLIHAPATDSVALYDPIVAQTAGREFEGSFAEYFGFDIGPRGDIQLKNGMTYFNGVPPNVSDRFYFDPTAPKDACLKLIGRRVAPAGGINYIQLNVLSDAERQALRGLAHAHTADWANAINKLATKRVETTATATPANAPYDSIAAVNYALTHLGPGAGGYATVIENDARNPDCGVNAGDPIQMHIIQLSTNLYAGSILPLEDPHNLLSEQLDILYTESFAGNASQFEFQWKRAEPNANGTTPSDYTNQYSLCRSGTGLTRFTIGIEGDTLPDMVNNFYVMRYRAIAGSPVYGVISNTWSAWIGPTLAEGWVQRVLNNVTPFTQRMQDMYNDPSETAVSMLQQAGGPYEGDVALNQDNLTSVGLIQLYQTVLNKAESMSLTLGLDNTAANQQLLLAASRLNDLYMLLGNEAYADALDPTIGFGSDFYDADGFTMGPIDYGALSSSLFCFDNLLPNLRDEELALLRGRSDELAPALTLSPTYNRLYWNFTKGVTAGEVAYAMNYQITGGDVTMDRPQAATLYPQGHGDAWGHYLSALNGYYRLMRNPYFSWGTPSISPLMVGDAVVDADYFDEAKFAESAAALARTGADVVKRTSEKAYVENGGAALAGYFDGNAQRAFGYGEWGARAGLAALYNWAAANSLLPPEDDPRSYDFMVFATNTQASTESPLDGIDFSADFTLEFQIKPDAAVLQAVTTCTLFDWFGAEGQNADGAIRICLDPPANRLRFVVQGLAADLHAPLPAAGEWTHVAITYSASADQLAFYLNGAQQGLFPSVAIAHTVQVTLPEMTLAANDSPTPFSGSLAEFRIWNQVRTAAELQAARDGVSANAEGLQMYQRFMGDAQQGGYLPDAASGAIWMAENPVWQAQEASGATIEFVDDSILRINRASVGSLAEVVAALQDVQRSVDMADAGLTPIGLSGNAIPFDIDPAELAAGKSHFEQILERSEQALANAATLLDRAQGVSQLQRQQAQNAANIQQNLANEEAALSGALIGIFGYPYEGDIGPGGTYPQGYSGPDIYHYMWMDLEAYGFRHFELEPVTSVVYQVSADLRQLPENTNETLTLHFDLAASGMVVKPDSITGTRRAQGSLQAAYGAFIQAYLDYRKALAKQEEAVDYLESEAKWAVSQIDVNAGLEALADVVHFVELHHLRKEMEALNRLSGMLYMKANLANYEAAAKSAVPDMVIAGLAVGTDIGAPIKGAMALEYAGQETALEMSVSYGQVQYARSKNLNERFWKTYEIAKDLGKLVFEDHKIVAELQRLMMEANEAALALDSANATLVNAQEAFATILAEGQITLAKRERLRKQANNRIAVGRYQDMAFRTFRSDALARYGSAFDLAKKYTYLTAMAYDYETALGMSPTSSGNSIFREIVGARALGFVEDGEAQLGGLHGDGGLADILARMKANWLVLKGRLGINNPQTETGWLSLRTERFRIPPTGTAAASAWQSKLSTYQVDNLLAHPEFRRYCLPFESSTGLKPQEPGLVIPFSTTIDFARNVFGRPLAGNDNSFDSSHFATKIRKLGVRFVGYNQTSNSVAALANTPRVYLIPVGFDIMRSPGSAGDNLLAYNVVDQVVPLPFPIGASALDEPDWMALYDAFTGNGDPLASIRRYPSLRAYHDQSSFADDQMISSTRLVGRSVWNTRWLLIIPAGTLHADRDFALRALMQGADLNGDGLPDQPGITDIQIGFEVYSNSGN
ncbi:MAG: LamG domain-containing protein [Candidatus Marinimicrobia bacterium]|nr:LamG domain-containing protein [Candidatus Neomarinimicrobiota bacterium]